MKKLLVTIASVILVFTFTACGSQESDSSNPQGSSGSSDVNSSKVQQESKIDDVYIDGDDVVLEQNFDGGKIICRYVFKEDELITVTLECISSESMDDEWEELMASMSADGYVLLEETDKSMIFECNEEMVSNWAELATSKEEFKTLMETTINYQ